MRTVILRNVEVGKGTPKIIVPIVARTAEDILSKGKELTAYAMDVVEWRVDFYDDVFDTGKVLDTAAKLNAVLGDTPILFTFRTKGEGGEKEISREAYTALYKAVAESGCVDAIDVEIFSGDDVVRENVANIHAAGRVVVGSSHDFHQTPDKADLLYRMRKMQDLGADLPKIAMMARSAADVATLLDATQEMASRYADRPLITMSMGPIGIVTRIAGQTFGSSMTFGAVGQVSAPGQIPVRDLQAAMGILHAAS